MCVQVGEEGFQKGEELGRGRGEGLEFVEVFFYLWGGQLELCTGKVGVWLTA